MRFSNRLTYKSYLLNIWGFEDLLKQYSVAHQTQPMAK